MQNEQNRGAMPRSEAGVEPESLATPRSRRPTATAGPDPTRHLAGPWSGIRDRLRARGLRWTPQRRTLVEVLAATRGHVTGAELVERCREVEPSTIPSTVYRTLAVLEELGLVWHGHGPDGRTEFHVRPEMEHGHLHCRECGATMEISAEDGAALVAALEARTGFAADLSHVTIVGACAACRGERRPAGGGTKAG